MREYQVYFLCVGQPDENTEVTGERLPASKMCPQDLRCAADGVGTVRFLASRAGGTRSPCGRPSHASGVVCVPVGVGLGGVA